MLLGQWVATSAYDYEWVFESFTPDSLKASGLMDTLLKFQCLLLYYETMDLSVYASFIHVFL